MPWVGPAAPRRERDAAGLTGGSPANLVYIDGKPASKLRNDHLVDDLEKLIRDKVRQKEQQQENMIARSV